MSFLRLSFFFLVSLSACTSSTGQVGVNDQVRFSQVQHFIETTDFAPSIVTQSGLLVQLELPNENEDVNPALTLVVTDGSGTTASANAEIVPLGFAQYAITLEKPGAYTLVAKENGSTLDTLPIRAADASNMRFHHTLDRTLESSSKSSCMSGEQIGIGTAVLTSDATLTFHIVPVDGGDKALLGLLELTATATGPVSLTGEYLGQGLAPNSFTVSPKGTLGQPAQIIVKDEVTGKTISFTLPTQNTSASCH